MCLVGLNYIVAGGLIASFFKGLIMAEEGDKVLNDALLWLQKQQDLLTEGFSVEYDDDEYVFLPKFIER